MLEKIISGGQTGADRAALDVALKFNIPYGGWVPKGRIAEDGPLPRKYQLQEMPTPSYPARTEQNVIDSDGTVIFSHGKPAGGTVLKPRDEKSFDDHPRNPGLCRRWKTEGYVSLHRVVFKVPCNCRVETLNKTRGKLDGKEAGGILEVYYQSMLLVL